MGIYNDLKRALVSTFDVIADKTSTQAQKSRLVTVMKNEEKIADQTYIALGKYLYTNLRDTMPEDVQQLCAVIDASKERMTRAQDIYREVIRQEQVNSEIGKTEVKENFRRVREPIVAGAASTAAKAGELVKDTAKDTAAKAGNLRTAAVQKADDLRSKLHGAANAEQTAPADDTEEAAPTDETADEDIINNTPSAPETEEPINTAPTSDNAEAPAPAVADETEPESEPEDSAEGVVMPLDIFPDEELEDDTIVKAIDNKPLTKARKLKDIITKKDENN